MLSEQVLALWRRLVAFMKALDLLHLAMRAIVPAHRHGHQNGQQREYILYCCFVCYRHGGRRGDTERIVARWRRPVASGISLDMLDRAMPSVSHRRTAMSIIMASDRGTFVRCCRLFCLIKMQPRPVVTAHLFSFLRQNIVCMFCTR